MAWFLVPPLVAFRSQLGEVAPNRDTESDGAVGNLAHQASASSHNPDETGSPEYDDHDGKDEVRAIDVDKDFNRPGLTAEMVVQHLVQMARDGKLWWIRYIIFNRRIWKASAGWVTQEYNGPSPHDHHFHINGQFSNSADTYKTPDYRLKELIDVPFADEQVPLSSTAAVELFEPDRAAGDLYPAHVVSQLGAIWGKRAADRSQTVITLVEAMAKQVALIYTAVPTDAKTDAKFNNLKTQVAQIVSDAQAIEAAHQETMRADIVIEVNQVAGEVRSMIADPSTPDQDVASALLNLLGDRRAAVLAAMNAHA